MWGSCFLTYECEMKGQTFDENGQPIGDPFYGQSFSSSRSWGPQLAISPKRSNWSGLGKFHSKLYLYGNYLRRFVYFSFIL